MLRRDVLRYAGAGGGSALLSGPLSHLAWADAALDPKACFAVRRRAKDLRMEDEARSLQGRGSQLLRKQRLRAGAWLIMLTLQSTLSVAQIAQGGKDIILGLLILGTIVAYGRRDVARA